MAKVKKAIVVVCALVAACSSTPVVPTDGGGGTDATTADVATADVAPADAAPETSADASVCGTSDLVTYSANKKTISTQWGCAVAWVPTNVATPISVQGTDYSLTVIGEFCPPDPMLLDPLHSGTSLNLTTSVGIWSLRFTTPNVTGDFQIYFDVYGGDATAQANARYAIGRSPGEFDDTQPDSCNYCDFGGNNNTTASVVDAFDSSKPKKCQLQKGTVYYYNVLVPAIDPRGNSSVFGWNSSF